MDNQPAWLEVSMTVDGELAEAVAEVLSRFTSNGVVVESGVRYDDAEDVGTPFGPVKVYGYLPMDDQLEERRQRLNEALYFLGTIQALPEPAFRTVVDEDWMAAWKKHYHPIPVGKRLLVLPAWLENPMPDRIDVRIDPSMAFGTGTHPSTQLCMELIEDHMQPGQRVIDVGCGSGILSIAAIKLGAQHALGVDIDSMAVRSTRENAVRNGVSEQIETGMGSVGEVLKGDFSLKQAPLVLANILAPVIIRLFDDGLADLIEPGGRIILAGILAEQEDAVKTAAAAKGLRHVETRNINDWIAMALQRP